MGKKKKRKPGRPKTPKETINKWLEELRPHLIGGATLWSSIQRAHLMKHKKIIYRNYNENESFREKIDAFRAVIGEYTNESFYALVEQIRDKVKRKESLSRDEIRILEFVAEKHRTSQPFFVSRTETAEAKESEFGKVVERPTININTPKPKKKDDAKSEPKPPENSVQPNPEAVEGVESPPESKD